MSKAKASVDAGSRVRPISVKPGAKSDPVERRGDRLVFLLSGSVDVRRVERIGEERVLDVGGDELLVLLLVLEAERDATGGFVFERVLQQHDHGGVDVSAVGEDGVERRAREGGAKLLLRHVAERVVVAVEEPAEVGMEGLVAGDELAEDEGLEEPAGVGEMPLDRARLRTRLHHHVLRRQGTTELPAGLTHCLVTGKQRGRG